MSKKRNNNCWWYCVLVGVACFFLGFALQFFLFEKELWRWDVRKEQGEIRVRVDRLERGDLQGLLDALEEHSVEIERALIVLGWHDLEEEEKK